MNEYKLVLVVDTLQMIEDDDNIVSFLNLIKSSVSDDTLFVFKETITKGDSQFINKNETRIVLRSLEK